MKLEEPCNIGHQVVEHSLVEAANHILERESVLVAHIPVIENSVYNSVKSNSDMFFVKQAGLHTYKVVINDLDLFRFMEACLDYKSISRPCSYFGQENAEYLSVYPDLRSIVLINVLNG